MRATLALTASIAATAVYGQAGSQLTLQYCYPGNAVEAFALQSDGSIAHTQSGLCVTAAGSAVTLAACAKGSTLQQWRWNADGTVASIGAAGQCWNANAGGTSINTTVILYSCGSRGSDVAANDIFSYQAPLIVGNESGLCFSPVYVPPPPPPPPGTCKTDVDCSLNGHCTAGGLCACYAPWTGSPNCEALAFLPAPVVRGYGMAPNRSATWGGSVAYSESDGLYHMFVAEMANDCPLQDWYSNSVVTHAVSSDPLGPFNKSGLALINWAHNPAIVTQKQANGSTLWALFHIGDASGGSMKNCTAGGYEAGVSEDDVAAAMRSTGQGNGSTLHVSWSPYGPWTPVQPSYPGCNNPAPWLHKNGTWYLTCSDFSLFSAPSVYGPWSRVTTITASNRRKAGQQRGAAAVAAAVGAAGEATASVQEPVPGAYEDPYLFMDARGNFHVIYHVYRTDQPDSTVCSAGHDGSVVSGHYYSADGFTWHAAAVSPYPNTVLLADGSTQLLSTRERPKILFKDDGSGNLTPTHLYNGVCQATSCVPTPCVNCKYDYHDFTNVVALDV